MNIGPQVGDAATAPPIQIDASNSTSPITDTSMIRPGRSQRRYTPINSAMGIVIATVNVPHGLIASAFTTTSPNTASKITMIARMPTIAVSPAALPISLRIMSPSDRPSRRVDRNNTMKSCTAPAKITPNRIHSIPGR